MFHINGITTYANQHSSISTKIAEHQCKQFAPDRIIRLKKDCPTRWHSKLGVIENYIYLRPVLEKVFPANAPSLLQISDEELLAECVMVLREVCRVARIMESDKHVTISRAPRLLKEL